MSPAVANLAAVALGGAIGASGRFLLAQFMHQLLGRDFPYGTLTVNVLGSLTIGYLLVLLPQVEGDSPILRLLLVTGILGGFTTFSAFSVETLQLVHDGQLARAGLNVLLTLALCFVAVWLGWLLGRGMHGTA